MVYDGYLGWLKLIFIGFFLRVFSWVFLLWGEGVLVVVVEWRLFVGICGVGVLVFFGVLVCLDELVFLGVGVVIVLFVGSFVESCNVYVYKLLLCSIKYFVL